MRTTKFLALPSNATHLLQPLDVAYFCLMKVAWRKMLKDWKETAAGSRCTSVPKDQFPISKTSGIAWLRVQKTWSPGSTSQGFILLTNSQSLKGCLLVVFIHPFLLLSGRASLNRLWRSEKKWPKPVKARERSWMSPQEKAIQQRKSMLLWHQKSTRQLSAPGATPRTTTQPSASGTTSSPEPQSSTLGIQQQVSLLRQKKQRRDSSSSSDDASAEFSLQDSEESETFSDLEEQPTPSTPPPQSSSFLQNLMVGDNVLVRNEDHLYLGQIIEIKNDEEVLISAIKKSAQNWRWPAKPNEIVQKINPPAQVGR